MPEFLPIFADEHPLYRDHKEAWKRDERRHYGGDAVLTELRQWIGEEVTHYEEVRRATAGYLNFAQTHTGILTGHLRRKAPPINYGSLGEVRKRDKLTPNKPTLAELFAYNCDGIGNDGSQYDAWVDGLERRAGATGFRWVMVEMPDTATLQAIRRAGGRNENAAGFTFEDQKAGFRPYVVEHSPLAVTNWRISKGVLQWAVIRLAVEPETEVNPDGSRARAATEPGYYVLVRKGYQGLGAGYSTGGWFLFDVERKPRGEGLWDDTRGQIPLFTLMAESSAGTWERPAMARSLTMELGQLAVGLMNLRSARDYNLIQAGKSIIFGLGVGAAADQIAKKQLGDGSIWVSVPVSEGSDGGAVVPQLWCSSEAASATAAFKDVIESTIAEAKEIMVRQVMGEAGSSGVSKEVEHTAANSPLLASLAATREQFENTLVYFVALRFGKEPDGSVEWPREFPIRDVLDEIDDMLDTMRRAAISSPTLKRMLVLKKAERFNFITDLNRAAIEGELTTSAQAEEDRKDQQDSLLRDLTRTGA